MLYVFGDCHIEMMHDLKKPLDNIELIGVRGLWSTSLNLNELGKIKFANTKNYIIPVDQDIVFFLGHADIRNIRPIYADIKANVESYVKFATTYSKPYFQNVYFAEPWPIWSDCPEDKLMAEDYFKKALHEVVEKYNTKVIITQKEIYESIGKSGVSSFENVPEKDTTGLTWPDEYVEKVLNLIVQKSLTL
jgi:hypothetical protein